MSRATFYIVQETSKQASYLGFLNYVVYLAGHFAKQQARVYLNCHDIKEAEQLAELFWQADEKEFIAHNLVGEGPKYGTKIEIGHQGVRITSSKGWFRRFPYQPSIKLTASQGKPRFRKASP